VPEWLPATVLSPTTTEPPGLSAMPPPLPPLWWQDRSPHSSCRSTSVLFQLNADGTCERKILAARDSIRGIPSRNGDPVDLGVVVGA
jgi:hypothetical protein